MAVNTDNRSSPSLENTGDGGAAFEKKLMAMSVRTGKNINVDYQEKANALDDEPQQWLHTKLEFMQPKSIKDATGKRPDHPEYDPTTLFVPKSYLESLTPVRKKYIFTFHFYFTF